MTRKLTLWAVLIAAVLILPFTDTLIGDVIFEVLYWSVRILEVVGGIFAVGWLLFIILEGAFGVDMFHYFPSAKKLWQKWMKADKDHWNARKNASVNRNIEQ